MVSGISKIAKQVLVQELKDNTHPERVEDVIFWALEHYSKRGKGTLGEVVASCLVDRIKEEEVIYQKQNN